MAPAKHRHINPVPAPMPFPPFSSPGSLLVDAGASPPDTIPALNSLLRLLAGTRRGELSPAGARATRSLGAAYLDAGGLPLAQRTLGEALAMTWATLVGLWWLPLLLLAVWPWS